MKKTTQKNTLLLVIAGLFVMAASQISSHYVSLPDVAVGLSTGLGIGLLVTALLGGRFKAAQ